MSCIPTLFTYIFNPFSFVIVFNCNKKDIEEGSEEEKTPLIES